MRKQIFGMVFVLLFIFNSYSCGTVNNTSYLSDTNPNNIIKKVSLQELRNSSELCVYIATDEIYKPQRKETKVYTEVETVPISEWQLEHLEDNITIIEDDISYIEPDRVYIVFLSKAENDDEYYLSGGKSGIFTLDYGKVKPLDYKMKKEVKTQWDNKYENFEVWFSENYEDPALTTEATDNLPENSAISSDIS